MNLKQSKTYKNLAKAYAGECQAYIRYKFIEYGARMQGYGCLAEIIDTIVFNEFNHARMFYTFLQKADNKTIDNIEISSGYPFKQKWDLVENLKLAAEDESFEEIATLFDNIIQVESCHRKMFTDIYNQMKSETLYKKAKPVKWKCADCGYEATGKEPWKKCPLCGAEQGKVMLKLSSE